MVAPPFIAVVSYVHASTFSPKELAAPNRAFFRGSLGRGLLSATIRLRALEILSGGGCVPRQSLYESDNAFHWSFIWFT